MGFHLQFDWAPAYEVLVSYTAYVSPQKAKVQELGAAWSKQVQSLLPAWFDDEVAALPKDMSFPPLLVTRCPGKRDMAAMLDWLSSMSGPQLYDLTASLLGEEETPPPSVLDAVRDRYLRIFTAWDQCYFSTVEPRVLDGLAAEAAKRQAQVGQAEPVDLVAEAAMGLRLEPSPELKHVIMVPQYHNRPLNLLECHRDRFMILYGMDPLPTPPGEMPARLRRLLRALDDDSRLQILRALGQGPRTFTEVVELSGLAKSTVHHHLITLRAAGLVWFHTTTPGGSDRYSLRPEALERLGLSLTAFLKGE